jgi:hypothetical protein
MPVSKSRKKPARSTQKRAPQDVRESMRAMAHAGAAEPMQAIYRAIQHWKNDVENVQLEEGLVNGFIFTYDRILKNADIPFDIQPAVKVLNRIHYKMPLTIGELELLYETGRELVSQVGRLKDVGLFVKAMRDMEIYGHVHGWEWHGIGESQPTTGAD